MSVSFESLEVWKAGCRLAVSVTKMMRDCRVFGFRDQMIRAAISIPSNIAEGSERHTSKDFRHFVHIALGSAAELRTQTYIAREAAIISKESAEEWVTDLRSISRMLQSLSDSLSRKPPTVNRKPSS
ncbi:MAG: hypothetical protein BA867_07085 [Desulfobacterales bacterium S5133MH16]|nr:MAG: hypothetical protein BA867_07085 [Desulfobacterales bacterium S5133MH16]